ncbi:sigma-70 family RNA polymerase sigma factor [Rubinisphaera margarita]|uniref:sigma-70 family RNA polymerase sigma factor n=1 Tax=Rubinisphaera margarita TaxID=2909586 RepID=UPI001EE7B795|nr:sigma-70 family RNA polymerase sigma factor [Rubinisphaera margarita]MCG6158024.1 sigma-70 family RNA polymerase sigma factor [Rubinisphaera margarita]
MSEEPIHLDEHTLRVQTLFVQHQQAVTAFVLSFEPAIHDAEEIVQETFVTASRKASTWTAGTNFLAWACAIARFKTMSFQRDRGRRSRRLAEDVVELLAGHAEDDFSEFQRRVATLRDCLRKLAPKSRELVNLRYHAGLMPEQIAVDIDWTANAVRVALTRARNALRECLGRSGEKAL